MSALLTGPEARTALGKWLALPRTALPACTPASEDERPSRRALVEAVRTAASFPGSGVFAAAAQTLHLHADCDGWRMAADEHRTVLVLI